ncbi:TPA: PepSY domain-containing protein [Burkholderia multivorans]|uniref:PepSY-associated TM helix domain-containing protein n=1 Tax=Burkholderia multivorans TaxID=87883 RepID=UPI001C2160AB|nr:PepSY-associated TM helix domain-containing protein [Burkholderia multivorans]MBU9349132.1 PepSY domain-containing protein [Burkholderia multivorans]MBU9392393.1 PepSY domain-containing protein [Burkholderia multivorans]HDR9833734.1 PepSY domain-containing protein [Burkholderia multivorans]HDR9843099.1 PepSY domain-containing protein [Burkholderia multivorans]HDR9846195.1 PepSY domain-containing protein [Burkholderia multivorans]
MKSATIRRWRRIHTWSGLVCAAFLLVLCVTGLPLIFGTEIEGAPAHEGTSAGMSSKHGMLDEMIAVARARYPAYAPSDISLDADRSRVLIGLMPLGDAAGHASRVTVEFDAQTGALYERRTPGAAETLAHFVGTMRELHTTLYAGMAGRLVLGIAGLAFVLAMLSGIVLYAPFSRRHAAAALDGGRSRRAAWLDLHMLVGVPVFVWALTMGATGVLNAIAEPLFRTWMVAETGRLPKQPPARRGEQVSVQRALAAVRVAEPGRRVETVFFPDPHFGSPDHYMVVTTGATRMSRMLFDIALVDARSGRFDGTLRMPTWLRAIQISRSLHFGNFGGMPLKIDWALLDGITFGLVVSGLVLWRERRRREFSRSTETTSPAQAPSIRRNVSEPWPVPILLGCVTAAALSDALTGDETARTAAAFALALPVAVIVCLLGSRIFDTCVRRSRRAPNERHADDGPHRSGE